MQDIGPDERNIGKTPCLTWYFMWYKLKIYYFFRLLAYL